jgi:predicted DNA-binding protein with PD1-like motif
MFKEYKVENILMGRIEKDKDLFLEIQLILEKQNIKSGIVKGIGAIQKGVVGYYDQINKKYVSIDINEPMEVLSLIGNISLKEGKPFPHCHVTLGDSHGNVKGGHLMEGCKVFAFEFTIIKFDGAALIRGFDKETHLPLWS